MNKPRIKSKILLAFIIAALFTAVIYEDSPNQLSTVLAYSVIESNAVDADSNVDGASNLGTSSQTYTSSQSQDGNYQNISESQQETYANGRNYRKNITIDSSYIDASLTNYPYLLDIYDTDLRTDTLANGWDIYFESNAEVELDFYHAEWDQTYNGSYAHLVSWIEIPSISDIFDTMFYMFYSNYTTVTDPQDEAGTWNGYDSVYNLDEGTGTTASDSLGNYDGTLTNMGASNWGTKIIDDGLSFNGGNRWPITTAGNYDYDSGNISVSGGTAQLTGSASDDYAHWNLNEASGTDVPDTSGNSRNGTTTNMEDGDWVSGKIGNALAFDGDDEYADFGDIANWEYTQAFSLEAWINNPLGAAASVMAREERSGDYRGWLWKIGATGDLDLYLFNTATYYLNARTTVTISPDTWTHVIITYDGSGVTAGVTIYVNSVSSGITNLKDTLGGRTILVPAETFQIGGADGILNFNGSIDEAVVYDREITQENVTARYNGGAGTETPITLGGAVYPTDAPAINPITPFESTSALDRFSEVATKPTNTEIKYTMSTDNGSTWEWWNATASAWETSNDSYAQANLATVINTNIATLGSSGNFTFKAYLYTSDSTATPVLDDVSLNFDEYVTISSSAGDFERTDTFSVGFWFYANESSYSNIISKKNSSNYGWSINLENTYLQFSLQNSGELAVRTTGAITLNAWYYGLITYSGNSLASGVTIYLNGSSQSKTTFSDTLAAETIQNTANLYFGMDNARYYYYEGFLDEIELFTSTIASGEASSTYAIQNDPENIYSRSIEKDGDNYQLTWEHQATSVDVDKYAYNLSIYGRAYANGVKTPDAISTLVGTLDAGTLLNIQTLDASTYNVSEVTGVPGFWVSINYTTSAIPSQVTIHGFYDGNPGHTVNVQIYNFTGSAWVTLGTLPDAVAITEYNYTVTGTGSDYVSGSTVATRIYHVTSGNPSDDLWLDYAYILADDSENYNIQMWNSTASAWGDILGTQITSSLGWVNQTIVTGYVSGTITWRYVSISDTYDYIQSELLIDYAGVIGWNFSINLIETTFSVVDYQQGSGNVSIIEVPLQIDVSTGLDYKIQIRGVDGAENPITNNYVFYDNDSVVTGAQQLTTSWTDLYTVRSGNIEETLYFWLWLDIPFGVGDDPQTCTLYIRIVEI